MLVSSSGIIFRTTKYSESSIIGDIYTEEKGLQSFIISGVRGKKGKTKAGLLQTASIVDVVLYDKGQSGLKRVKEIRPDYVYSKLPFEIARISLSLFFIELCRKTIKEAESNPVLFEFLKNWFIFLDQTTESLANAHIVFMLELSHMLGFGPSDLWTESKSLFDLREGIFVSVNPGHPHVTNASTGNYLHLLFHFDKLSMHELHIPKPERIELLNRLIEFYALQIENFGAIKSLDILQEIFQ